MSGTFLSMFSYLEDRIHQNRLITLVYWVQRIIRITYFKQKIPLACSLAPTVQCNLHCPFCYTANPRRNQQFREMSVKEFHLLCKSLRRKGIRHVTLTDGEPLLTAESREKCTIASNIFDQCWIVTNGTVGFPKFKNTLYIVSIDGTSELHNQIRGKKTFEKIHENVKKYRPEFYCNITISKLNHNKIPDIIESTKQLGCKGVGFAFSTPLSIHDKLFLNQDERCNVIEQIQNLKLQYGSYICNEDDELEILSKSWGYTECPKWYVESYDAFGKKKLDCVFGKATEFMCDNCGCNVYPSILSAINNKKKTMLTSMVLKRFPFSKECYS